MGCGSLSSCWVSLVAWGELHAIWWWRGACLHRL